MDVTGFQAERHGSGYQVSVRLFVGAEELGDNWLKRLFERLQVGGELFEEGDHVQGGSDNSDARATKAEPDTQAGDGEPNHRRFARSEHDDAAADVAETSEPRRRGRRRKKAEEPGSATPADETGDKDGNSDRGTTRRRSRRGGSSASGAAEPSEPVAERPTSTAGSTAGTGRRSRRKATTAEPADGGQAKPAGRRRRASGDSRESEDKEAGNSSSPAPSVESPSTRRKAQPTTTAAAEITDADLTKACSEAAEKVSYTAVMAVIEEFGVGNVGELGQDVRQEFIDRLMDECAKEGGDD